MCRFPLFWNKWRESLNFSLLLSWSRSVGSALSTSPYRKDIFKKNYNISLDWKSFWNCRNPLGVNIAKSHSCNKCTLDSHHVPGQIAMSPSPWDSSVVMQGHRLGYLAPACVKDLQHWLKSLGCHRSTECLKLPNKCVQIIIHTLITCNCNDYLITF